MTLTPAARLSLLSAMRWFPVGLVVPVMVLLLGARGLPLNKVGQVMALYGVVTLMLELPTGGLADSWGRRPVIVGSAVMQAAGLLILGLFGSLSAVLVAVAVLGAARALSSGPLEAWFVDTMHGSGPGVAPAAIEGGLAKGQISESLALGLGSVIGGLLPRTVPGLPESGGGLIALSVPFIVASAMAVLFAVTAVVLVSRDVERMRTPVGPTVRSALRTASRNAPVRAVLVVATCLGVVLSGVELLSPNAFADLLGDPAAASAIYGVLTAVAFAVAALGAWTSTRIRGRRARVGAAAFLGMAVLAVVVSAPSLAVAATAFLGVYLTIGLQGPVMAGMLHDRVESGVRATMMSVESLALQSGGAIAGLVVGSAAAAAGLLAGYGVVALAAVFAAVVLLRDLRQHTTPMSEGM